MQLMHKQMYTSTVFINGERFDQEGQKLSDLKGVDQHLGAPEQWEVHLNTQILYTF